MYRIFDTETTGNTNQDVIQISSIGFDDLNLDLKTKPLEPILPIGTVTHGVTQEEADTYPDSNIQYIKFLQYFQETPKEYVWMAHNIQFDLDAIQLWLKRHTASVFEPELVLDTIKLARKVIPEAEIGSFKLDAVFYYLFPKRLKELQDRRQSHDALEDCRITEDIVERLLYLLEERKIFTKYQGDFLSLDGLKAIAQWLQEPVFLDVWPFGKKFPVKGSPLVLGRETNWFMKQDWKDNWPDVVHTIGILEQQEKNVDAKYSSVNI